MHGYITTDVRDRINASAHRGQDKQFVSCGVWCEAGRPFVTSFIRPFYQVERFFAAELGQEVGVKVADAMRRVLLYADDLVLMADTPEQLQQLLDCLSRFCMACCMTANTTKSEIMCFNTSCVAQRLQKWTFNGATLPVVQEFRYLGVLVKTNNLRPTP